jgi:hypothetical protein
MATRPEIPLETLHGRWVDAITAGCGDALVAVDDTHPGYEHTFATHPEDPRERRLVVVCPWHWPAYSHYQFWELAAVPWLARRAGYRDWCLVTNGAWTDWILPALEPLFGAVLVGDEPPLAELQAWLSDTPDRRPVRLPREGEPGRTLLGDPTPKQTTVTLKAAIAGELGDAGRTGVKVPARLVEATLRPNFHVAVKGDRPDVAIFAKAFRNPDVVHEAKMMMGRAWLCPPGVRPVVVIDGRWRDAPDLIASSGADVCTVDRLGDVLAGG